MANNSFLFRKPFHPFRWCDRHWVIENLFISLINRPQSLYFCSDCTCAMRALHMCRTAFVHCTCALCRCVSLVLQRLRRELHPVLPRDPRYPMTWIVGS